MNTKRMITGQLALGDAELTSFGLQDILAKINAARLLAGMNRVLLLSHRNKSITQAVLAHCKSIGIEVYLWYKILSDNEILPDQAELGEDAWGTRGGGESGIFQRVFDAEEVRLFACPRNPKYNTLVRNRCVQQLEHYDGLFIDCIGFPLPSFGLESFFTCFCPVCMEIEPRLRQWRDNARDVREYASSCSDADLENWGTIKECLKHFELDGFLRFRHDSINSLVDSYAAIARDAGKKFAVDVVSPSLAFFGSHDYLHVGNVADWIKPRIYFRVFGPSNLPVEFYSLTMGHVAWGKRYTIPGVMKYIERSTGIKMPTNVHSLAQNFLTDDNVIIEINRANDLSSSPVHPGFECALHPDYNTGVDAASIKNFLSFTTDNPGLVLSWNLLYVPDNFLKIIGENL